jgi:hypothetical protein
VAKCLIRRASLIGDIVVVDPFVCIFGITTITTIIRSLAGDENLRGQIDVRPLSVSSNFNTIRKGRTGSESPARSTIDGNMLVPLNS